jgi:hypothetical protein
MKFEEQTDATKIVRWGQMEAEDIKENVYVVKKDTDIIGKIKTLEMLNLTNPKGEHTIKPAITLELISNGKAVTNGETVRFITPAMLQTELGLNPTFMMKERCAAIGDIVRISYLGKKKNANMHLFKVAFGKE